MGTTTATKGKIMPLTNEKVIDAKPRLSASIESDNKVFTGQIVRGHIAIQRVGSQSTLRIGFGEVDELAETLNDLSDFLSKNKIDSHESYDEDYTPNQKLNVSQNPYGPRGKKGDNPPVLDGTDASDSGSSGTSGSVEPQTASSGSDASDSTDNTTVSSNTTDPGTTPSEAGVVSSATQGEGAAPATAFAATSGLPTDDPAANAAAVDARNADEDPFG